MIPWSGDLNKLHVTEKKSPDFFFKSHAHIFQVPSRTADIKPDMDEAEGKPDRDVKLLGVRVPFGYVRESSTWLQVKLEKKPEIKTSCQLFISCGEPRDEANTGWYSTLVLCNILKLYCKYTENILRIY